MLKGTLKAAAGAAMAVGLGGLMAVPAGAAQTTDYISCGGTPMTIRVNENNSSDNGGWSVAHLVDSKGHLIPASFHGVATDLTTGNEVFSFSAEKGKGNANKKQAQITCGFDFSGTWAEVSEGEPLPEGVGADDIIQFVFTAKVVVKQK